MLEIIPCPLCHSVRVTHLSPVDICNPQPTFHNSYGCKSRSWSFTQWSPAGKPEDDDSYTHDFSISVFVCEERRTTRHQFSRKQPLLMPSVCYDSASSLFRLQRDMQLRVEKTSGLASFKCPAGGLTPRSTTCKPLLPTVLWTHLKLE